MTPEGIKELTQVLLVLSVGANFAVWQKSINAGLCAFCLLVLIVMWLQS